MQGKDSTDSITAYAGIGCVKPGWIFTCWPESAQMQTCAPDRRALLTPETASRRNHRRPENAPCPRKRPRQRQPTMDTSSDLDTNRDACRGGLQKPAELNPEKEHSDRNDHDQDDDYPIGHAFVRPVRFTQNDFLP